MIRLVALSVITLCSVSVVLTGLLVTAIPALNARLMVIVHQDYTAKLPPGPTPVLAEGKRLRWASPALTDGVATCDMVPPLGGHIYTVVYGGDATHFGSQSMDLLVGGN